MSNITEDTFDIHIFNLMNLRSCDLIKRLQVAGIISSVSASCIHLYHQISSNHMPHPAILPQRTSIDKHSMSSFFAVAVNTAAPNEYCDLPDGRKKYVPMIRPHSEMITSWEMRETMMLQLDLVVGFVVPPCSGVSRLVYFCRIYHLHILTLFVTFLVSRNGLTRHVTTIPGI